MLKTTAYSILGGGIIGKAAARGQRSGQSKAAKGITGTVDSPLSNEEIEEARKSVFGQGSDRESTAVAASINNEKTIVGYAASAKDGILNEHYETITEAEMDEVEAATTGAEQESAVMETESTGRGIEDSQKVAHQRIETFVEQEKATTAKTENSTAGMSTQSDVSIQDRSVPSHEYTGKGSVRTNDQVHTSASGTYWTKGDLMGTLRNGSEVWEATDTNDPYYCVIQRGGQQPSVDISSADRNFHNEHTTQELAFQDTELGSPYLDSYAPQGNETGHIDLSFTEGSTKEGSAVNVSMDTPYISRTDNVNQDTGQVKFDYDYPDSTT